jgi:hypothetical protein
MDRSSADVNSTWWVNGESNDYYIYTTPLHLITLILPDNTRAFSFNVGADLPDYYNNNNVYHEEASKLLTSSSSSRMFFVYPLTFLCSSANLLIKILL